MRTYNKYLVILLMFAFIACESDDDTTEAPVVITAGEADFSTYVALGNSLTAGFTDNALFISGQNNSMPNILAQQFALAGGGTFKQPLMNDNIGGALLGGTPILTPRLYFYNDPDPAPPSFSGPRLLGTTPNDATPAMPTTEISNIISGPFNNLGVPGAKSFHLLAEGYGSVSGVATGQANPYFVRMASSTGTSILKDAIMQNPTFFSLWIGNNDVLGYALSGGDGTDPITDIALFNQAYNGLIASLTSGGAKGIVANIPDVTSIPFFTTIPNNALVLDASQAADLTGFFQAVEGIVTAGLILQGVDPDTARALASQYAITFNEGPNRWLIDVPVTQANPLGFRQMTEEELLVLTIDQDALREQGYGSVALSPEVLQVLGILQSGGTPTQEQAFLVLGAVNGLDDKDVLDIDEITEIKTATDQFNATIRAASQQEGLAFLDARVILEKISTEGIEFDGFLLKEDLVFGGAFSLDGVHPTARGYAFLANKAIEAINETYQSNIPLVKASPYTTLYPEMLP